MGEEAIKRNNDPQAVHVIIGASRGIGLEFTRQLLQTTQGHLVACCRDPQTATGLTALQGERITIIPVDVEQQATIDAAADTIKSRFGRVDSLYNVAGLLGDNSRTQPGPERTIASIDRAWFERQMAVNAIGPAMVTKALTPLLATAKTRKVTGRADDHIRNRARPVVVNISARAGSIGDNFLGGWYTYRASKCALNQLTRTFAHELLRQGTWTVAFHPGPTDTDLLQPFKKSIGTKDLVTAAESAARLIQLINGLEEKHTGGFYDHDGKLLPW